MPIIPIKTPRSYSLGDFSFSFAVPKDFKQTYEIKSYKLKRAEIINKNSKWCVHISIEIPQPEINKSKGTNYAGIDLGIRNLITLAVYDKPLKGLIPSFKR